MMRNTVGFKAAVLLSTLPAAALARCRKVLGSGDAERGDVPGWVMITLMSAVLVAGILALAKPALEGLFNDAMSQVGRP
jgi:hypothetical protein